MMKRYLIEAIPALLAVAVPLTAVPDNRPSTAAAVVGVDLDAAIKAVAAYRFGKDRRPLYVIERLVDHATSIKGETGVAARRQLAEKVAAAITPDAVPEVKGFFCRQLGMLGAVEQVPLLASLLTDEQVSQMARHALELIPGPSPVEALCDALDKSSGRIAVGIINSLGNIGDERAFERLGKLLNDSDKEIASSAAAALGRIGSDEAAKALVAALFKVSGDARTAICEACLSCADKAFERGDVERAAAIYRPLHAPTETVPVRMAALRGLAYCDPLEGVDLLIDAVASADTRIQSAGVQVVRRWNVPPGGQSTDLSGWTEVVLDLTPKPEVKKALITQLRRELTLQAMNLAVSRLQDPVLIEEAARTAVTIGQSLLKTNRAEVKSAMQAVLAVCKSPETVADVKALLRQASRSANLAIGATPSSPDGLEPDGGSGPDAAAIDGNPETYWDEQDGQMLYRFKLVFPNPTTVSAINIKGHAYQSHSPRDFEILCDDKVVKTVSDAQYDPKTNEFLVTFQRTTCATLELKITGYYGASPGIRELEVYDYEINESAPATRPSTSGSL